MRTFVEQKLLAICSAAIVAASFSTCVAGTTKSAPAKPASKITFEATASTRGPEKVWSLVLQTGQKASFEMRSLSGSELKGTIVLDESDLSRIAAAANSVQFSSLPELIGPTGGIPLHEASFRLRLTQNGKTSSVELYAPAQVEDRSKVNRFLIVWNAIFDVVALQPSLK